MYFFQEKQEVVEGRRQNQISIKHIFYSSHFFTPSFWPLYYLLSPTFLKKGVISTNLKLKIKFSEHTTTQKHLHLILQYNISDHNSELN